MLTQSLLPHLMLPGDCQQDHQFNSLITIRCSLNAHFPADCHHLLINDATPPNINHKYILVRYNPASLQGFPFLGGTAKLRKSTIILVMRVCPPARLFASNNSAPTERIFMKFDIRGTLHEDQCIFMIIFRSVLPRMRNISDKFWRENQNTHFIFSNFFSKNVPFMRCGKLLQNWARHRRQHGA